jgi:hypothetical protein
MIGCLFLSKKRDRRVKLLQEGVRQDWSAVVIRRAAVIIEVFALNPPNWRDFASQLKKFFVISISVSLSSRHFI